MIALLALGFTACDKNFEAAYNPKTTPQESILQASDVNVTPAAITTINLADLLTEDAPIVLGTVSVKEGAMPEDMKLLAVVNVAKSADFSDALTIDAEEIGESNEIALLPSKLQEFYYEDFTHDPNPTTLYMRTNLYTTTGESSKASIGNPAETFFGEYTIAFTPANEDGRYIANAYYAVVKGLDGKWIENKFDHSETNVYDDPEFTVTIAATQTEAKVRQDTEFYIVAEEDLAAFQGGDKSVAFGKGEGEHIAKGGAAFIGEASDGTVKYNITLEMDEQVIIVEPVVQFYCYYLYANPAFEMKVEAPEENRCYMFYKTGDTTYTLTTFWPNNTNGSSLYNAKVWEREAMLKSATTSTWGFNTGGTRAESGKFKQGGGWLGPLTEGWYTFTINMDEENETYTYQWTAVEKPATEYTNISVIGTINGSNWDKDFDLTQCAKAPHNWYLLDLEVTEKCELKFRANHNWDTKDWGGDKSQPINPTVYTLPKGSENITVPAGTYDLYLNDITGDWTILKTK